jgi:hypothetical protein
MRLRTRLHEWLADRVTWVQYPDLRKEMVYRPTLGQRWHALSTAGKGWVLFVVFWDGLILISIWGNTLP